MKHGFIIRLVVDTPENEIGMLKVLEEWLPKKLLERGIELTEVLGSKETEFIGVLKEYK